MIVKPFKITLSLGLLFLLLFHVLSCTENSAAPQTKLVPAYHQWNEQEKTILKSLHIDGLEYNNDRSNRINANKEAIAFGQVLFFDQRFSANNKVACATCHQPEKYFTDGLKTAQGIGETTRNTPTIVAANYNHWFFHDGRADSLWSQALGPLENAAEHGSNRSVYAQLIFNTPSLRQHYEKIFSVMPDISDPQRFPKSAGPVKNKLAQKNWQTMTLADQQVITQIFVNIGKSLAAYESSLSPDLSRFDHYIDSLMNAKNISPGKLLEKNEALGLRLFIGKAKCVLCHSGPLLTDNGFHNIATVKVADKPYDLGRYEGAKQVLKSEFNCRGIYNDDRNPQCDELKYISLAKHETLAAFKTPSLRSVSKTAPYMHDGRFDTLKKVIQHYTSASELVVGTRDLLLPINLNEQEIVQLAAFLRSLDSSILQK